MNSEGSDLSEKGPGFGEVEEARADAGPGRLRIEPGEATRLDRDEGETEDEPFGMGLLDDLPAEDLSGGRPPRRRGRKARRSAEAERKPAGNEENGGGRDAEGRPEESQVSGGSATPDVEGRPEESQVSGGSATPGSGTAGSTEGRSRERGPEPESAPGPAPFIPEAPPSEDTASPQPGAERREGRRRRRRRRGQGAERAAGEVPGASDGEKAPEPREAGGFSPSGEADEIPDAGEEEPRRSPVRKRSKLRPPSRRRPGRRKGREESGEVESDVGEAHERRPELSGWTESPDTSEEESNAVLVEEPGPVEEAGAAESAEPEEAAREGTRSTTPSRGGRGAAERERAPRQRRRRGERDDRRGAKPRRPEAATARRILINATDEEEIRIAVLGSGQLEELYYERPAEKKYLGNIYKGRVVNLEPAIQAAFVDLGIGRNGFLHVSDVLPVYKDATKIPVENLSRRPPDWKRLRIQDILRRRQEVLVQISKDSIGGKGPSLTTYVSVPGKYLVLMPGVNRHGVSKRIQDSAERAELRDKLASLDPPEGIGYIVRTAGEDKRQDVLAKDFEYLMGVWEEIRRGVAELPTPSLIYAESDLVIRAMRDFFATEVDEILIDEPSVYERARRFLVEVMPEAAKRVKCYTGRAALFTRFGVEEAIERIYNRRVPLPSGGHLVIEQTEALVAIDVNSGKYRDEENLEATALKTNLEAAEEIARQLRLRDLGGVIIIDFIDMEVVANRREVEGALRDALREDRAKSWFTRISRFGIVEMTRQRVRPSLERSNYEPCRTCRGTGVLKSPRNTGIAILRQLRETLGARRRRRCEVIAHPDVASYLVNERRRRLLELESEFEKAIVVRGEPDYSPEQYIVRYV